MSQSSISPQLAYILDNPDDDTARLVYADYLEEQGESARAEFIRLQIRIANDGIEEHQCWQCHQRLMGGQHQNGPCRCSPELRRMNAAWLEITLTAKPPSQRVDAHETFPGFAFRIPYGPDHDAPVAHFNRGFIEVLHCTVRQWLAVADDATARHPIREVFFSPPPHGNPMPFSYKTDGRRMTLMINSHHGMKTIVDTNIPTDAICLVIMNMIEGRWPKIVFHWNPCLVVPYQAGSPFDVETL